MYKLATQTKTAKITFFISITIVLFIFHNSNSMIDSVLESYARASIFRKRHKPLKPQQKQRFCDERNYMPVLHQYVCDNNEVRIAGRLLTYRNVAHQITADGDSALHIASYAGFIKIMQMLINYKADINLPGKHGWSPLHYAVLNNRGLAVIELIKAGADIEKSCQDEGTPLNFAILLEREPMAKLLIALGANINNVSKIAINQCNFNMLKNLIVSGADYTTNNDLQARLYNFLNKLDQLQILLDNLDINRLVKLLAQAPEILKIKLNMTDHTILHTAIKKYREIRHNLSDIEKLNQSVELILEKYPALILVENGSRISALNFAVANSPEALKIIIKIAYKELRRKINGL